MLVVCTSQGPKEDDLDWPNLHAFAYVLPLFKSISAKPRPKTRKIKFFVIDIGVRIGSFSICRQHDTKKIVRYYYL